MKLFTVYHVTRKCLSINNTDSTLVVPDSIWHRKSTPIELQNFDSELECNTSATNR